MTIELKLGTRLKILGDEYEVSKVTNNDDNFCENCPFDELCNGHKYVDVYCKASEREDNTEIYFKRI